MKRRHAIAIDVVEQCSFNLTLVTHILHHGRGWGHGHAALEKVGQPPRLEQLQRFRRARCRGRLLRWLLGRRRMALRLNLDLLLQLRLILGLESCRLRCLRRRLRCLVCEWAHQETAHEDVQHRRTLATPPAQSDPAPADGEALHLFDGAFGIRFPHKLHETAVLAHRDLDLDPGAVSTLPHNKIGKELT